MRQLWLEGPVWLQVNRETWPISAGIKECPILSLEVKASEEEKKKRTQAESSHQRRYTTIWESYVER